MVTALDILILVTFETAILASVIWIAIDVIYERVEDVARRKMEKLYELYQKDENFKAYVDRYANKNGEGKSISIETALTHKIVQNVAKEIMEKKREGGKEE